MDIGLFNSAVNMFSEELEPVSEEDMLRSRRAMGFLHNFILDIEAEQSALDAFATEGNPNFTD